ncbi:MAG: hypothetical protein HY281_07905 [Nitrospirae bacterium]|nr:hypothetical protein [Nitrospirota bacterium]
MSDQLAGLVPPLDDETNTGFHLKHTGPAPLTDGNAGTHGFECVACQDSNLDDLLIVRTFTNSTVAVVLHQVPQFAGRIQVKVSIIPPSGWSCLTDCNFDFVEEIAVDGLSQIEASGPNHQVIRGGLTTHPLGTSATPETLNLAREFAWMYKLVTGNGISYNDFSLPYGGKFDLANGYAEGDDHQGHRRGTQFDINSQDLGRKSIDCLNDQSLRYALAIIGASARGSICHATGAYHVQF